MPTLKIPAAYLEDVRSAVIAEIANDSDMLSVNHQSVIEDRTGGDPTDRTDAAAALHNSLGLLDQILHATGDATLEGESGDLTFVLEKMVRLLAARLDDAKQYGPMNMGAVVELAERLRWAAEEAIAMDQRLDGKLVV